MDFRVVIVVDPRKGEVRRLNWRGQAMWATSLRGDLSGVRPPHQVIGAERVFVTHDEGVTALDLKTGKFLWHSKGPASCMLLSGNLLLAAQGARVAGRDPRTGKILFLQHLTEKEFDPNPIRLIADLILVEETEWLFADRGKTFLLDRQGSVRHRLERNVLHGQRLKDDLILLTSKDIVCLRKDSAPRWSLALPDDYGTKRGQLVVTPGGAWVGFWFCEIADSGVGVMRFDPASGKAMWSATCPPLEVSHSKYRHTATLTVVGGKVSIRSIGSFGTFVEVLNLETGKRIKRWQRLAE
jgi:hypothetical protein